MAGEGSGTLPGAEARSKITDHFVKHVQGILPAQDDDDDGVGDHGDAGEDGHDDAEEGVDEVEGPVELGRVHQVAGCHVWSQTQDPAFFVIRNSIRVSKKPVRTLSLLRHAFKTNYKIIWKFSPKKLPLNHAKMTHKIINCIKFTQQNS